MSEIMEQYRFCVISKDTFNEYGLHDIQTNNGWTENPYGEEYAVVPYDMVDDIMATCGYCDIELNEDGTEVVGFTAKELPVMEISEEEDTVSTEVTTDDMANAIKEGVNEV